MPTARPYVCIPGDAKPLPGFGVEDQRAAIERYYDERLKALRVKWLGWYEDPASAVTRPLANRSAGSHLLLHLEAGDHVVIAKMSQAFRSARELLDAAKRFQAEGVTLHLLDIGADTSTDLTRQALLLLDAICTCEWEARSAARRRVAARQRIGGMPTGKPPYGFKLIGSRGRRRLAPDRVKRRQGGKFLQLFEDGYSLDAIYWWAQQHKIRRRGGREWSRTSIWEAIRSESRLRSQEAGAVPSPAGTSESPVSSVSTPA